MDLPSEVMELMLDETNVEAREFSCKKGIEKDNLKKKQLHSES